MVGFFQTLVRNAEGRVKRRQRERRTEALYDAALRLLAKRDYEKISIAAIGREARCSVGAFYSRFHDKNAFLQSVISAAFHALTVESANDLAPERWRGVSRNKTIAGLVRHIVAQMSRDQAAGAARAALKLTTIKPDASEPFLEYRAAISNHAVALLAPHPYPGSAVALVRGAVQLIFAMVIDTTLHNAGPLRLRSPQMIDKLSDLIGLYLKLPHNGATANRNDHTLAEGKPPGEPKIRHGLLRPDMKELVRAPDETRPARARRERSPSGAAAPARVNPRKVRPARSQETGPNSGQRPKRRFRTL